MSNFQLLYGIVNALDNKYFGILRDYIITKERTNNFSIFIYSVSGDDDYTILCMKKFSQSINKIIGL